MNRLPPEVIALCATFVSHSDPRPIISLTHVCQYWRKVITSSPRNWASIGNRWKRLTPLCLQRAGVVPLTVDIAISDIRADAIFLEGLLPFLCTPRIAYISLTGFSIRAVANAAPDFFASPMRTLISLDLQQTDDPAEPFPSGALHAPPISWQLTKLKSLCLTRTPLYPALASVTSLVELKLIGYTTPFHFGKFVRFLHSNPNLELIASDIRFVECSERVLPSRTVSFPRLRHLSFTCTNPIDARGLISSIPLPRGAHLEVAVPQMGPRVDLRSVLPSHSTPIQELLAPITTIKYRNEPRVVQLYGNDSRFSFWSQLFAIYSELSIFTTDAVREFHLKISRGHDLSWPLSRLPALETLVLVDVSFLPFPSKAFAFLAEPTLCPSLKTIAFFNCNLDRRVIESLEGVVAGRRKSAAAWLHRVVIVRKTGALPDHELIHRLRKYVPCVDARIDEKLPDLS